MIIKSVKLTNFRSHTSYVLECTEQTSVIIGPNGCGKTSVIEAIYEALEGKSFRAVDAEILKRGAEYYRVELEYENADRVVVVYDGKKKSFITQDKQTARLPKTQKYPVVLFLPEDMHLLIASPLSKRTFFDRMLGNIDVPFANTLRRYDKALRQRNELLKNMSENGDFTRDKLIPWDGLLAQYGVEIRQKRRDFVEKINLGLTDIYRSIAENEDLVEVKYLEKGEKGANEQDYLRVLEGLARKDIYVGHTTYGPHLDNFEFVFNGVLAQGSASRGEARTLVLALKFQEAEMIFETLKKRPVVLLDDVFSELDADRQRCLVSNFKDNQVIITSVDSVEI